jgi:hypothetical protein
MWPLLPRCLTCAWNAKGSRHLSSESSAADATVPVTLMHPIFCQFVDDCENHKPNRQDNELVLELMVAMSDFFPDKDARAARLREILTAHGIPIVTSTITSKGHNFRTDGSVTVNGGHFCCDYRG